MEKRPTSIGVSHMLSARDNDLLALNAPAENGVESMRACENDIAVNALACTHTLTLSLSLSLSHTHTHTHTPALMAGWLQKSHHAAAKGSGLAMCTSAMCTSTHTLSSMQRDRQSTHNHAHLQVVRMCRAL
jgi:hypothetical protein